MESKSKRVSELQKFLNRIAEHTETVSGSLDTHTLLQPLHQFNITHTLHNAVCNGCSSSSEKHKFTPSLAAKSAHVDLPAKRKNSKVKWRAVLSFGKQAQKPSKSSQSVSECECMCSIRASSSVWCLVECTSGPKRPTTAAAAKETEAAISDHTSQKSCHSETQRNSLRVRVWKRSQSRKQGLTLFTGNSEEGDGAGVPEKHCETGHFAQLCESAPRRAGNNKSTLACLLFLSFSSSPLA